MLCNVSDNCVCVLIEQAAKNKRCFLTLLFWDSFDGWDHSPVLLTCQVDAPFGQRYWPLLKSGIHCLTMSSQCHRLTHFGANWKLLCFIDPFAVSTLVDLVVVHYLGHYKQESRAVARKPPDAAAVLFGLKFADNIHYKFKGQASKARLHSSKHTGIKQNLRQNGDSRSFKVTCFGVSGKAIRQ